MASAMPSIMVKWLVASDWRTTVGESWGCRATACTAATAITMARLRRRSLILDCKIPDLDVHFAFGIFDHGVLAGRQLFQGPDLVKPAIELLLQDIHHDQL